MQLPNGVRAPARNNGVRAPARNNGVRAPARNSRFILGFLAVASVVACASSESTAGGTGDGGEGGTVSSGAGLGGFGGTVPSTGSGGVGSGSPSCSDGMQDGSEEGVDCGGPCPACCMPETYQKDSGLVSGTATICCDDPSDSLVTVEDCGRGMNHGAHEVDGCGYGFEGAMNGGSACVKITCSIPCSGTTTTTSSSSSSSSSSTGGSGCTHDKCTTGVALDAGCDACVGQICAADDFCCDPANGEWDAYCVGAVTEICGLSC